MNGQISSLLFLPFDKGQLQAPDEQAKALFWNTAYIPNSTQFTHIDAIENYKFLMNTWKKGQDVNHITPDALSKNYDFIFTHLPHQKDYARSILAQSAKALDEQGVIIAIAANDAGGKNIDKWMKEMGLIPNSLSKNKCRIVWAKKQALNNETVEKYCAQGSPTNLVLDEYSFISQPGVYGWNKVDRGSQLLLQNLPNEMYGSVADMGCGYGYLSGYALKHYPKITKLYALDADKMALECAQKNLEKYNNETDIEFGWSDVTSNDMPIEKLDFVIMNPPFHQGKNTQNSIGQNFISKAHQSLKKKGTLYMVANAHLPYERHLNSLFDTVEKMSEGDGYKVYKAQK